MKLATPAALLLCFAATGCATMVNHSTELIPVTSEPPGAVVSVDCGDAPMFGGKTPTTIEVPRTAEACSITVAKEGYGEEHIEFQKQPSRATLINEIPGVAVGTLFSIASLVFTWDTPNVDGDVVIDAYSAGHALGSTTGNAIDAKKGGAFKWVPGKVDLKLQPSSP